MAHYVLPKMDHGLFVPEDVAQFGANSSRPEHAVGVVFGLHLTGELELRGGSGGGSRR